MDGASRQRAFPDEAHAAFLYRGMRHGPCPPLQLRPKIARALSFSMGLLCPASFSFSHYVPIVSVSPSFTLLIFPHLPSYIFNSGLELGWAALPESRNAPA